MYRQHIQTIINSHTLTTVYNLLRRNRVRRSLRRDPPEKPSSPEPTEITSLVLDIPRLVFSLTKR
ncbi:hypothetical protein HanHA300_Chr16g0618951 [Helianthus annuus]|nr:hypothetical protein HanHA300_Chr16g0618951 [Helianthus annuus]KAJ0461220.1 hypothetical protein HanHA89_Chr16g0669851 [Helianthus annuus]KAJ0645527.1 hypothetical protein HanOQP8_Chr16g0624921 [Helianthus annuus]